MAHRKLSPSRSKVSPAITGETSRSSSLQSLHYNEIAVDAENQNVGAGSSPEVVSREVKWIQQHVRMRKCVRFVRKTQKQGQVNANDADLCECGYSASEHSMTKVQPISTEKWNIDNHTRSYNTDTFGEVVFPGYGETERKYVRVDVKSNMSDITTLMMDIWNLEKPNLLISVTGGAKNFRLRTRLKEVFRRGLMKVARSTGAWIITGGSNTGVMKHVGEAVRDYGLTSVSTTPVVSIGIATWGCVQNQEDLTSKDGYGLWPARYRIERDAKIRETFLDPNHTHFILVDDATRHQFGGEIKFRARLEKAVSEMKTDTMTGKDAVSIPVVLLVLQGGPNTLKTIKEALSNNTPVVIVGGSGMIADVVEYAYQNVIIEEFESKDREGNSQKEKRVTFDPSVSEGIRNRLEQLPGIKDPLSNTDVVESVIKNHFHLITVFKLSTSLKNTQDIDIAILQALLKANQDQVFDQLKLALAWNRIDIAKSDIFTDDRTWQRGSLDEIMLSAVYLNRVHFVELFVDNGISLIEFLTAKRLLQLYNKSQFSLLNTLLAKMKQKSGSTSKYLSLMEVGLLLQDLLGDFYSPLYLRDSNWKNLDVDSVMDGVVQRPGSTAHNMRQGILNLTTFAGNVAANRIETGHNTVHRQTFENPYQQLFLWSVLMNRQDMAKLFWKQGKESIAAALVAYGLLNGMANKTDDSELEKKLRHNAIEFGSLASEVLNECYEVDEKRAQDLLVRVLDHWGGVTCVLIAVETGNKEFISQTACQSLLNRVWRGKLSTENGTAKLLMCMMVPPLIFPLLKYKHVDEQPSKPQNSTSQYAPQEEKEKVQEGSTANLQRRPTMKEFTRGQTVMNFKEKLPGGETETDTDQTKGVNSTVNSSNFSVWEKIYYFYTAPVIIFSHNVISYIIFLLLFSYMLLMELRHEISIVEIVVIVWVFSIFAEEVRQVVTTASKNALRKIQNYIMDTWNIVDVITIILFIVGMILRLMPNSGTLEAARVVLGINLITFFFRILHIFSVHQKLGPILVMIEHMFMDLLYFIIILMVVMVSYAIASFAILYPQSTLQWSLIQKVLRNPYWNLYGELLLEEIEIKDADCTNDIRLYDNDTYPRCPSSVGREVVPILMGLYVLFSNILLLNLLIAMFSFTIQKIQDNTDLHWYFQRYFLIYEYYCRPSLPPPFILLSHVFLLIRAITRSLCKCCVRQESDLVKKLPNEREIIQWENVIADTYWYRKELKESDSVDNRLQLINERMDLLVSKMEEIQEGETTVGLTGPSDSKGQTTTVIAKIPYQLEVKLDSLQNQMNATSQALAWIVKSLQENNMAAKTLPPKVPDFNKEKEEERKRIDEKKAKERKMLHNRIENKANKQFMSRHSPYPGSTVKRFPVPDEKLLWDVSYEEYKPVLHEDVDVTRGPDWADKFDLMNMSTMERQSYIKYNCYDDINKVERTSYMGKYRVVDHIPLNPMGRTGIVGRGKLGKWGPNFAGDPVITRWKKDKDGNIEMLNGKRVFEFVCIKRSDNKMWSLPGGICDPGENVYECVKTEFSEEALGSLIADNSHKQEIVKKLKAIFKNGKEIYKGYADDSRNTDNAWLETMVYSYHDEDDSVLRHFPLRAGETVDAVMWATATSTVTLHGGHSYYLQIVAERLQAAY